MKAQIIKHVGVVVLWSFAVVTVFWCSLLLFGYWQDGRGGSGTSNRLEEGEYTGWQISDGECNIAVVPIDGEITTSTYVSADETKGSVDETEPIMTSMSETLGTLGTAEYYDPNILGVLMLIDSPGGSGAASQMIADELRNSSMPNAAYVFDVAASGGYLIATGVDRIFANPFADVGSIGVTMSYLDYSKQNTEQGLEYVELASAKFKDSGDPDKQLTAEEKALFERDLKIHHETFVKEVATNRNLKVEDVAKLADGSTLPAPLALEAKLIDQIGGKEDVRAWFADQLRMTPEEVIFCQ
jgi:signal peptide peptidase SppA